MLNIGINVTTTSLFRKVCRVSIKWEQLERCYNWMSTTGLCKL